VRCFFASMAMICIKIGANRNIKCSIAGLISLNVNIQYAA
jgi:hypothetical protein